MISSGESIGRQRPDSAHSPAVELGGDEVFVFLNDRKPCLMAGNGNLVQPAVFVVGGNSFFLRADWCHWRCVTSDQPGLLQGIAKTRRCVVVQSEENGTRDHVVPVYRIPVLPPELFHGFVTSGFCKSESTRQSVIKDLSERFQQTDAASFDKAKSFSHVHLNDIKADFVVSSDDECILFAVLPHEFDTMCHEDAGEREMDSLPQALDHFLRRMECCRKALSNLEPLSTIHLALLEQSDLSDAFSKAVELHFEKAGIEIVLLDDFEEFVDSVFG